MGDAVANVVAVEAEVVLIEAWPEHWPVWVKEAVQEMENLEKPSLHWIPINSRKWVLNVFSQVVRCAWPKLAHSDPNDSGPFVLGLFVGHQLEAIHMLPLLLEEGAKELQAIDERLKRKVHPKTYQRWQKHGEKYAKDIEAFAEDFDRVLEGKGKAIEKVMAGICERPITESAEFFRGISQALQNRVYDDRGEMLVGGSRFRLYVLLMMFWRFVESLKTSTQLYRFCCFFLTSTCVGDLGTFQRLCREYQIRLGARGKPLKKRRMKQRNRRR